MRRFCIVPARGGSKRFVDKHLQILGGLPLIDHTLDTVLFYFDKVIFTTDSPDIMREAAKYCIHDNFMTVEEPPELATDTSKVIEVVNYIFEKIGYDYEQIWLCLPTCPLRTREDIVNGINLLTEEVDGVLSITDYSFPPTLGLERDSEGYITDWHSSQPWQNGNSRSQEHPVIYRPNGAFYGMWCNHFGKVNNFYRGKIKGYYMPRHLSVDIDQKIDLLVAEHQLREKEEEEKKNQIENVLQKLNEKINQDLIAIGDLIKNKSKDPEILTKYVFKWGLVRQECEMYCLIGEQIDKEEFEALCKNRGFDEEMSQYIIDTMKYVGLGNNLK